MTQYNEWIKRPNLKYQSLDNVILNHKPRQIKHKWCLFRSELDTFVNITQIK